MTRKILPILLLPLLASCGGDSPAQIQTDMLEQYQKLAKFVDAAQDEASAKISADGIVLLKDKISDIATRYKKQPKVGGQAFSKAFPDTVPVVDDIRLKLANLLKKDPKAFAIIDAAITEAIGQIPPAEILETAPASDNPA